MLDVWRAVVTYTATHIGHVTVMAAYGGSKGNTHTHRNIRSQFLH